MDQLDYIRMRQERYMRRKQQRMQRRRRRNIIFLMVVLIIIAIAAICFLGSKVLPWGKTADNNEATNASASGAGQIKPETKKEDKPAELPVVASTAEEVTEAKEVPQPTNSNYASYYCYEPANQSRYESYHAENPHLSIEDVVWQVNACLDQPFYGYDVPVADINDPLVIVNKYHKVSSSQEPANLVTADGYLMTQATATAYQNMKRDAKANGLSIVAASTYRSVSYQDGLYNRYLQQDPKDVVDTYSARPGYSEHHTGMAIDFIGSFGSLNDFENTPEYPWVRDNCHKYGFIIRYTAQNQWITGYKNEPWHLRYVGTKVATDMKNKGVSSFEEYKVKYIDHRP